MAEVLKRKTNEILSAEQAVVIKRSRTDDSTSNSENSLQKIKRSSTLQAPIMLLSGHESDVLTSKFNPSGDLLATAGNDKSIFLWNIGSNILNCGVLKGHSNAILDLRWSANGDSIFSVSADKSVGVWNVSEGTRLRKYKEHANIINCCDATRRGGSTQLICSGSDDGFIKIWDPRVKKSVSTLVQGFQVTSVSFSADGKEIFVGSIDNAIHVWDSVANKSSRVLRGHGGTITGLSLSPDGNLLLSNSMDSTVRLWSIRDSELVRVFKASTHSLIEQNLIRCAFSADGKRVAAGSSDRTVVVWDVATANIQYKLPGHKGCVNDVDFHPSEPILVSASSDKQVYLSELD